MGDNRVMKNLSIKKVFVEGDITAHALGNRILDRLPSVPAQPFERMDGTSTKKTLLLLPQMGGFLKPCPGTKEYICCGYQILNIATNCPLGCSYCILQSYFDEPILKVFTNLQEELGHTLHIIDSNADTIYRVGTGEFTDSLALDPITGWTDLLLPLFSKRKNAVLELKTKTTRIEGLLASRYRDRIIVSWSLNSPYISSHEEHGTASLKQRLEAARICQAEGFILGFHFDPLIPHPQWREEYLKTIELMDRYLDPKGIIWISLGSFRFMPGLKSVIMKHHPKSCVLNGEFIRGMDGKMRYFKPIRLDLYNFMRENLDRWYPDLGLYLCMESDDVWQRSLGWSPENSDGLRQYLDRRVIRFFG